VFPLIMVIWKNDRTQFDVIEGQPQGQLTYSMFTITFKNGNKVFDVAAPDWTVQGQAGILEMQRMMNE